MVERAQVVVAFDGGGEAFDGEGVGGGEGFVEGALVGVLELHEDAVAPAPFKKAALCLISSRASLLARGAATALALTIS